MSKNATIWNIVNAFLAGVIFFLGAISDGQLTRTELYGVIATSLMVAVVRFRDYWQQIEGNRSFAFF